MLFPRATKNAAKIANNIISIALFYFLSTALIFYMKDSFSTKSFS
jgi:hypothetical protein